MFIINIIYSVVRSKHVYYQYYLFRSRVSMFIIKSIYSVVRSKHVYYQYYLFRSTQ
jgi:hypothetical protein